MSNIFGPIIGFITSPHKSLLCNNISYISCGKKVTPTDFLGSEFLLSPFSRSTQASQTNFLRESNADNRPSFQCGRLLLRNFLRYHFRIRIVVFKNCKEFDDLPASNVGNISVTSTADKHHVPVVQLQAADSTRGVQLLEPCTSSFRRCLFFCFLCATIVMWWHCEEMC